MVIEPSPLTDILQNGWPFDDELFGRMSAYEKSFAAKEFGGSRSTQYYVDRLQSLQITGMSRVLDAACGMGQWTLALAKLNDSVVGVDLNEDRIKVARTLAAKASLKNVEFSTGSIEELPFPDGHFDAIFCYGSFMFTQMPKTLREFSRLLKPDGILYLNANAFGWYAHMILDLGFAKKNWAVAKMGIRMLRNWLKGEKSQIPVTKKFLNSLCLSAGLQDIRIDREGRLGADKEKQLSAYPSSYYLLPSIWELTARKSQPDNNPSR